ncbi:HAMP domain-containing protein [Paenibacillus sp. 5J-6]|uniref:HAMP domain-containing protein n=1 Tax=Paenibacillus silvestris TaxID=2606219 RepID=A0A6L8UUW2_9BACL|nr:sensor histidine kinase [Paenibacillus silvestris]MZQ81142.1 HAMP domain-containing protein [Paenibacillus silvestris]
MGIIQHYLRFTKRIRFKIFILNSTVVIAAVLLLGLFAYQYTLKIVTQSQLERMEILADRTEEQLSRTTSDLQQTLSLISSEIAQTNMTEKEIEAVIRTYNYSLYPLTQNIFYIEPSGHVIQTSETFLIPADVTDYIINQTGSKLINFIGPYYSPSKGLISTVTAKVRQGTEIKGILAIDINSEKINKLFMDSNIDKEISTLVFNNELRPILSDIKLRGTFQQQEYSELFPALQELVNTSTETNETKIVKIHNDEYIVRVSTPDLFKLKLLHFVNKDRFLGEVEKFKNYTLWFAGVFTLIVFILSLYLARSINQPIQKLIIQMNRIKNGNLHIRIRLKRQDEFLSLAESFNEMLDRIETLVEEKVLIEKAKKKFELKALRSQINPHFLYNTLNSINALVDLNRTEEIPKVLNALVRLFQYTMDHGLEFTELSAELEGLEQYVYLQQIRYQHKFEVQYSFEEELLSYKMLKLSLQPIVENAIFHGIKGKKRGEGSIHIGGGFMNGKTSILLFVEDNGTGMSPERLTQLLIDNLGSPSHARPKGFNSIGLRNVHERYQLNYGKEYGLHISSQEGLGTRVELLMPAMKGDDSL